MPTELAPLLAVFAMPVPPMFGVLTGGVDEGAPCWPAWLAPLLAALEISALVDAGGIGSRGETGDSDPFVVSGACELTGGVPGLPLSWFRRSRTTTASGTTVVPLHRERRGDPMRKRMKFFALGLVTAILLVLASATAAFAGQGNGVSSSHGSNSFGNAVSSGATPQPSGH